MLEKTFQRYDTAFTQAEVDNRQAQFHYTETSYYYFLDQETFEQHELTKEQLGNSLDYLTENMMIELFFYKGSPLNVILPTHVELKVVETPPAIKGDTAQGGNKPATQDTGLRITVPKFVTPGTVVKVDSRNGEYIERVG